MKVFQAYLLICIKTGRQYIGVTGRSLAKRWHEHVYDSKRRQTSLARAIAKHGARSFTIEAICSFRTWDDACSSEDTLIRQWDTRSPNGYNMMPGGRGRGVGFKPSAESVERSAEKHRGLPAHPNTIAAARARRGIGKPEGHGAKVAAALKGKPRSEETKTKIRAYWADRRERGEFKTDRAYQHHARDL